MAAVDSGLTAAGRRTVIGSRLERFRFSPKKWLTLQVEVAARDLDSRILLGCAAAIAGFNVIIGSIRGVMNVLPALPKGVWLIGNIDRSKIADLRLLKQSGYRIVCLDEEAFLHFSDDHYTRNRLSEEGMSHVDAMMTPGPDVTRMIREALPDAVAKVVETGNPRIDLLRPELRAFFEPAAREYRERFGRFILVNTNFSENAMFGSEMLRVMRTITGGIVTDADRAWESARRDYELQMFDRFVTMLRYLGEHLPDVRIVLRPHPQEDLVRWRRLLSDYPNISVIFERSVHPWALAAAAVVHNSCTTAIESHLMGRPVFAYRPIRSAVYDMELANAVSEEVTTLDAMVARLKEVLASGERAPWEGYRSRDALEHTFGPLEGRFSYERILDVLETLDVEPQTFPRSRFPSPLLAGDVRELMRLTAQRVPFVTRRVFSDQHLMYLRFDYHKFPTLRRRELVARIRNLGRARAALSNVEVTEIGRNIFVLSNGSAN